MSVLEVGLMDMSTTFENNLENPDCGLSFDFNDRCDSLILAFGGINGGLHMPPFEFFNTLKGIPSKKIFVRDLRQCWYHQGIPGYGNTISQLQLQLFELIKDSEAKRVIALGASSGGYAALLFGLLLQLDEVHAFSPKTNINPVIRFLNRDLRYRRRGLALLCSPRAQRKFFDIAPLLRQQSQPIDIHLHFGDQHRSDTHHAQRIAHDSRVHLHPYAYDKHLVAAHLRDQGLLKPIIQKALKLNAP